jgi:hypothetical protein
LKTKRTVLLACIAGVIALGGMIARPAGAQHVGVEVNIPSGHFNLQVGHPPHLVPVPGVPVYHVPSLPHNYFVYMGHYYLFHNGAWYASARYNGPWMLLAFHQVPRPILSVPVTYYKVRPSHWKKHGPPPWAHEVRYRDRDHDRRWDRDHDRRDRDRDRNDRDRDRRDGPGRHR